MAIVLHHCVSARSFRPLWLLEEAGVSYELKMLAFPPRVRDRRFMDINPLGTVPLMTDGNVMMTESAAICEYLAQRFSAGNLNVLIDEPAFGAYLNFLHFGEATLTFPQTLVLRYKYFEPPERRQSQVADDYTKWFLARLRTLEPLLQKSDYLCAGRFTAADISVGYALMLAEHLALRDSFTQSVSRYWERLRSRAGFNRPCAPKATPPCCREWIQPPHPINLLRSSSRRYRHSGTTSGSGECTRQRLVFRSTTERCRLIFAR